jgi:hypothetical protein
MTALLWEASRKTTASQDFLRPMRSRGTRMMRSMPSLYRWMALVPRQGMREPVGAGELEQARLGENAGALGHVTAGDNWSKSLLPGAAGKISASSVVQVSNETLINSFATPGPPLSSQLRQHPTSHPIIQ